MAGNNSFDEIYVYFDETPPTLSLDPSPVPQEGDYIQGAVAHTISGTVLNMEAADRIAVSDNGSTWYLIADGG